MDALAPEFTPKRNMLEPNRRIPQANRRAHRAHSMRGSQQARPSTNGVEGVHPGIGRRRSGLPAVATVAVLPTLLEPGHES